MSDDRNTFAELFNQLDDDDQNYIRGFIDGLLMQKKYQRTENNVIDFDQHDQAEKMKNGNP